MATRGAAKTQESSQDPSLILGQQTPGLGPNLAPPLVLAQPTARSGFHIF